MPPRWSLDSAVTATSVSSSSDEDDFDKYGHDGFDQNASYSEDSSLNDDADDDSESRDPSSSCSRQRQREQPSMAQATKQRRISKKSVRFAEYASLHLYYKYRPGEDPRLEEPPTSSSTWYNKEELHAFRLDTIDTVNRIVAGDVSPVHGSITTHQTDNDFCSRGCECRTPMGTMVRHKQRMESLLAVLQYQQQCQRKVKELLQKQAARQQKNTSNKRKRKTKTVRLADVMDPHVVATLYQARTQQSQHKAHFTGLMDYRQVEGEVKREAKAKDVMADCNDKENADNAQCQSPSLSSDKLQEQQQDEQCHKDHHHGHRSHHFWDTMWDRLHHMGSASSHHHHHS